MALSNPPVPMVYMITSLSMGGAQKVLLQLLDSDLRRGFRPVCIVILRRVSGLESQFSELGIPLIYLEFEKPWRTPGKITEIIRMLKNNRVRFLYSVMHHANLFSVFLKWLCGRNLSLIWSIHDTPLENLYTRPDHRFFLWLTQKLSGVPKSIVVVSVRSRQRYIQLNYPATKLNLIPNGVPVRQHDRNVLAAARRELRAELGLGADAVLIGSLTRYVTEKDIPCMLEAFSLFQQTEKEAFLVLAGEGIEEENSELSVLLDELAIADSVFLLGIRSDAEKILRGLDIATLSSRSEALPLFIAEAMGEGVPVVATSVGDIPLLLGDTGELVAPENPSALKNGWQKILALSGAERWAIVESARHRVASEFSVASMVDKHRQLFENSYDNG
ncbi:MAG: glycosyltransferase [Thiolinea sp.]